MSRVAVGCLAAGLLFATFVAGEAAAQVSGSLTLQVGPPAPRYEAVPPPRSNYVWAPGYWSWNGRQYVWIAGRWRHVRRGYEYSPGHWDQGPNGWVFARPGWHRPPPPVATPYPAPPGGPPPGAPGGPPPGPPPGPPR